MDPHVGKMVCRKNNHGDGSLRKSIQQGMQCAEQGRQCTVKLLGPACICSIMVYRMTCKKLMGQTPFRLVCGVEVVMPMEYIVRSLCITMPTTIMDHEALEERLV